MDIFSVFVHFLKKYEHIRVSCPYQYRVRIVDNSFRQPITRKPSINCFVIYFNQDYRCRLDGSVFPKTSTYLCVKIQRYQRRCKNQESPDENGWTQAELANPGFGCPETAALR